MAKEICKVYKQEEIPANSEKLIIAGDVSATNIFIGLYSKNGELTEPIFEASYKGQKITDFNKQVINDLLKRNNLGSEKISAAVFSPAGPIINGKCKMTNAPFSLSSEEIGVPTALINDFAAIGYCVATRGISEKLENTQLNPNAGKPVTGEVIGVEGAGTGFGTGRLIYDKEKRLYNPVGSEGGHKFLPIDSSDSEEIKIHNWLRNFTRGRKPAYEHVLSGRGIDNLFKYHVINTYKKKTLKT